MRKIFTFTLIFSLLFNLGFSKKTLATNATFNSQSNNMYTVAMKRDLLCLMLAYPNYIENIEEKNGCVYLVMHSGKKLLYDDKENKTSLQKLANSDLEDTLEQIYPLTTSRTIMNENFDPGRYRSYGLLLEVYGTSKQIIESNLTKVNVGGHNYQFNNNSGASVSLQNVMKQLTSLAQSDVNVSRCLFPCNGTFNYRVISGTNRLSPHAFGIAIDLASDKRDYWKWATKEEGAKRLEVYSKELVEIFEKNGFVWGGKWSHFDILHFEYRPEIILKALYFTSPVNLEKPWYDGAPIEQLPVKEIIGKVNKIIGV